MPTAAERNRQYLPVGTQIMLDASDKLKNATWGTIGLCFFLGLAAISQGQRDGARLLTAIGFGLIAIGCYFTVRWFIAKGEDSE